MVFLSLFLCPVVAFAWGEIFDLKLNGKEICMDGQERNITPKNQGRSYTLNVQRYSLVLTVGNSVEGFSSAHTHQELISGFYTKRKTLLPSHS
jgi:hypothetical protein